MNYSVQFYYIIPEIYISFWLLVIFCFQFYFNCFLKNNLNSFFSKNVLSLCFMLTFLVNLLFFYRPILDFSLFNNLFINDKFIFYFKLLSMLFILLYLFILLINIEELNFNLTYFFFFSFLCFFFLPSVNNFILLYLILEINALIFLVLIILYIKFNLFGVEASVKYFILNAITSGLLFLGIIFYYGFSGTITISSNWFLFLNWVYLLNSNFFIILSFSFILLGFFFKLSLVPFHNWVLDVYIASPLVSVGFFSILPKLIYFFFLLKFYILIFFHGCAFFLPFTYICILLSLIIGSFGALGQTNLIRFWTFSTIVHFSFIFSGFLCLNIFSIYIIIYYLFIYLFITFSFFIFIFIFKYVIIKKNIFTIGKNIFFYFFLYFFNINKYLFFFFSIVCFSLSGIPPFAGFFGKLLIFYFLLKIHLYFIFVIFLFFSLIICFYYLRLIKIFLFKKVQYFTIVKYCTFLNKQFLLLNIFFNFNYLFIFFNNFYSLAIIIFLFNYFNYYLF